MSATARALGIAEILTSVLAQLPEPDFWAAATVSLAWWDTAQYVSLLLREERCTSLEKEVECVLEGLCLGPRGLGRGVRHLTLSTQQDRLPVGERHPSQLHTVVRSNIKLVLRACPNVTSVAVYGDGEDAASHKLLALLADSPQGARVEWLRLSGPDSSWESHALSHFTALRHLRLDEYDLNRAKLDWSVPAGLVSLVVSAPDLSGRMLGTDRLRKLARATGAGLRHLALDFIDAISTDRDTGLTTTTIKSIPDLWPWLQVLELFLFQVNVDNHLARLFGLLKMPNLHRLRLRLRVPISGGQTGGGLKTKLAQAVAQLSEEQQKKVEVVVDPYVETPRFRSFESDLDDVLALPLFYFGPPHGGDSESEGSGDSDLDDWF